MLNVNLTAYHLNKKPILSNISFTLSAGKNLTILGENGAGKSTLAKLLCGLLPSQNAIMIEGNALENIPHKQRSSWINYIPDTLHIYDSFLTVYDFLQLGYFKKYHTKQEIEKVLSMVGLKGFEKAYCSRLSSGEGQLLLTASALLHHAKITIFDEPTSNLDPQKTKQIFSLLASNLLETKIIITHDLQLAYKLNYPILFIHEGRGYYHDSSKAFFTQENLDATFAHAVEIKDDVVRIRL